MRKYEVKQFIEKYKEANEIAKQIWEKFNTNDKFHSILIENGKIMILYDDGFYLHCEDITKEFIEEVLPDNLIF